MSSTMLAKDVHGIALPTCQEVVGCGVLRVLLPCR